MPPFSQFAADMQGLNKKLMPTLLDAAEECAELVASTARDNCTPGLSPYDGMVFKSKPPGSTGAPYDTGEMRDTIQSSVSNEGRGKIAAVVWTPVDYASYVHEGTSKMQARPFIADAVKMRDAEIQNILFEAVRDLMGGGR